MDSAIKDAHPNDFATFFRQHHTIERVIFASGAAENFYKRYVIERLPQDDSLMLLSYRRVPSPSPAHASLSFADKLTAWRAALAKF